MNLPETEIIKEGYQRTRKLCAVYINLQSVEKTYCDFADNMVITVGKKEDLQANLKAWNEVVRQNEISIVKRKDGN